MLELKEDPNDISHELNCPYCDNNDWTYLERVEPNRLRFECKNCNKTIKYDFSNRKAYLKSRQLSGSKPA